MKFSYKARTKDGKEEVGSIEASSRDAAVVLLQKYNVFVTSLQEGKESTPFFKMRFELKPGTKDLVVFFRQLAVMLESRVPVVQSLESLASQTKKQNFKEIILKVAHLVEEGMPLSGALSSYPAVFEGFYINLVKSGETSGNIATSMDYISRHLEKENDIIVKIRQAMVYPVIVLGVLFVVLGVIMVAVMPRIVDLVKEATVAPTFSTALMLGFYAFVQSYWWIMLIIFLIFVGLVILYLKTKKGKENFGRVALQLPLVGDLLKKVFLNRFCDNIATLMSAGISINHALEITATTVNNVTYAQIIGEIEKGVSEGEKMSAVMERYPDYFPLFVVQMIRVGEQTGKLDKTLLEVVNFYEKEVTRTVDLLTSLIEPFMIIALGVIVALLAVSVLSPIYNVLGNL